MTLDAIPLNKIVLDEFAALDRDMPPLDKGQPTRAFAMFDILHNHNLSGAKTKGVQNMATNQRNFG